MSEANRYTNYTRLQNNYETTQIMVLHSISKVLKNNCNIADLLIKSFYKLINDRYDLEHFFLPINIKKVY